MPLTVLKPVSKGIEADEMQIDGMAPVTAKEVDHAVEETKDVTVEDVPTKVQRRSSRKAAKKLESAVIPQIKTEEDCKSVRKKRKKAKNEKKSKGVLKRE